VALDQTSIPILENTNISEARRAAARLAQALGLGDTTEGNLAIVVSELARNILLHGGGGEIVLQPVGDQSSATVDILALDKGQGIPDLAQALRDGYSSAGTPGTGLGAVRRLASACVVFSANGSGTAVLARVDSSGSSDGEWHSTGGVSVPVAGETQCGDAWAYEEQSGRRLIIVADGLGHGAAAADAAQEALAAFRANLHRGPRDIVEAAHGRLQKTRGAAVAVTEIDFARQIVRYSGVGNIASAILSNGKSRSMVSHNGIVGHQMSHVQEFTFPWERGALLVMHSDGVGTRWNIEQYPGLPAKPAALIAGVLYRDFKRGRDDATVVVSRESTAV
jgi:anti-sigma regulatory factor (Ser/Thr protein kinase)